NDDTTNLSILATAKKISPHIVTIARENEMENLSLFQYANIHYIFMPSRLLIHKTINALIHPLSDRFLHLISNKNEMWARDLANELREIGANPSLFEMEIGDKQAYALMQRIREGEKIYLDTLVRSRSNPQEKNSIKVLLLLREGKPYLLPQTQITLNEGDQLLFACSEDAVDDIEYIAQNIYELGYILKAQA
ncbi:MAG: potassium transporter TrkA, partial [Campylobacterales bacterium]|nr:potassium transporter TrkA [Campylobacterales bacterium]